MRLTLTSSQPDVPEGAPVGGTQQASHHLHCHARAFTELVVGAERDVAAPDAAEDDDDIPLPDDGSGDNDDDDEADDIPLPEDEAPPSFHFAPHNAAPPVPGQPAFNPHAQYGAPPMPNMYQPLPHVC